MDGKTRLLFVDADETSFQVWQCMANVLDSLPPFEFHYAADATEALEGLDQIKPDVIVLNFSDGENSFGYSDIIIAEVKQEYADRNAPCIQLFKENSIRQARISKYCIGMGLMYPELKSNRFKSKYLMIEKIRKNDN